MKHLSVFSRGCIAALILYLALAGPAAWAQAPAWQTAMDTGSGYVKSMAADGNGNVFLLGEFNSSTMSFGGLTFQNGDTHAPGPEIFLVKWNPVTNRAVWGVGSSGMGGRITATGLAVDGPSVYVTGTVEGNRLFGGVRLVSAPGSSNGTVFLAKLTDAGTSGSCTWAQYVRDASYIPPATGWQGPSVAVNGSSVYLAGRFGATSGFGTLSATSVGRFDSFVAKLTDTGASSSFTWIQPFGGAGNDEARTVAVNGANVYVGGRFEGTATFGMTSLTNTGVVNGFVAKLIDAGTTGSIAWAKSVGGAGSNSVTSLSPAAAGVYAAGTFDGTATFDANSITSAGATDGFVAKLADGGTTGSFVWGKPVGGVGSDDVADLAPAAGGVYAVGGFNGTVSFGSASLTSAGGADVFVTKLTDRGTNGDFAWTQQAGSTIYDGGNCIAAATSGALYVGGSGGGGIGNVPINFGSILLPAFSNMGFLATLTDATALAVTNPGAATAAVSLYPNPARAAVTVQLPPIPGAATATLTLLDALGRPVRTATVLLPAAGLRHALDLTGLTPGLYALRVAAGGSTATRRLVVE